MPARGYAYTRQGRERGAQTRWLRLGAFKKGARTSEGTVTTGAARARVGVHARCADAQGFMRKRVASINEAPILESERRIAVPAPLHNAWLADQGVRLGEHPLGGGAAPAYE